MTLNETVTFASPRPSGCYVAGGYANDFLLHDEVGTYDGGTSACEIKRCVDGVLSTISCASAVLAV
jgi:hypothetical protein